MVSIGYRGWIIGFYDDAHAALPREIKGIPVVGDIAMLKSLLSVEAIHVVVAIADNGSRLKVANSLRAAGAQFITPIHPKAYVSPDASLGDGSVVTAGAVVHPDVAVGSHCYLGSQSVIERDAVVGAGAWISSGAVVGSEARIGARVFMGANSSVPRKVSVGEDIEIAALTAFLEEGR